MLPQTAAFVRPWQASDVPSLFAAVRSSITELSQWMPWCHADYSLADAEAWVTYSLRSWAGRKAFPLGVFDPATGEVIGATGILQINEAFRIGNMGYWVSTPHTGKGVATAAARHAAALAFGELGLTRIEIAVLPYNAVSRRVARSAGAVEEGIARNRLYHQGRPHDAVLYSLVPSDMPGPDR